MARFQAEPRHGLYYLLIHQRFIVGCFHRQEVLGKELAVGQEPNRVDDLIGGSPGDSRQGGGMLRHTRSARQSREALG